MSSLANMALPLSRQGGLEETSVGRPLPVSVETTAFSSQGCIRASDALVMSLLNPQVSVSERPSAPAAEKVCVWEEKCASLFFLLVFLVTILLHFSGRFFFFFFIRSVSTVAHASVLPSVRPSVLLGRGRRCWDPLFSSFETRLQTASASFHVSPHPCEEQEMVVGPAVPSLPASPWIVFLPESSLPFAPARQSCRTPPTPPHPHPSSASPGSS